MPVALIPQACMPLYDALNKIRDERNALSEELKHAAPGEKPAIAHQIKQLLPKLEAAQVAFENCVKSHPNLPATWPVQLTVSFKDGEKVKSTTGNDTLALEFDTTSGSFLINSFPDLKLKTVEVMGYMDDITVKRTGSSGGSFNKQTGAAGIDLDFSITHSLPAKGSTLSAHFTTGTVPSPFSNVPLHGSPMDAARHMTLVAVGTLVGGPLDGHAVTVTMTGTVSAHP